MNDPRYPGGRGAERRQSDGGERGADPYRSAHEFERDRRGAYGGREFGTDRGRAFEGEMHDPRTGERAPRPMHPGGAGDYEPYAGARHEPYASAHQGDDAYRFAYGEGGARRDWRGDDEGWHGTNVTDYDDRDPAGTMRGADPRGRATPRDRGVDTRYTGRGYHYPGGARYPEESGRRNARDFTHFDENRSWDPDDRDELWRRGEYGSRLYGNVIGAATPSGTAGIRRYDARRSERRGPKGYARSDERLRDDICERLSDEAWLDLSEVEVHVSDGHVRLEGEVPDRFSKYAIEDIADGAWGVKDVENRIRIRLS